MCKRKRNSPESHLNFVRGLLRLRANERALSNSGGFRLLFAKPKTYPLSQAPPAKPEACELEPLKAAIVFC
jgi:hypothetical protein